MATKSSKGSAWERDVCKILTKWVSGTEKPYLFWRGRGSGGMFTQDSSIGTKFSGDIYSVGEEGQALMSKISIECKNGYEGASLDLFLKENKNDPLEKFWIQALNDATKSNKLPFLIFKKKNMPVIWLCIPEQIKIPENMRYIKIAWKHLPDMYITSFKDFLQKVTYAEFMNYNM